MTPWMGSAGWLGHQPITVLRRPFWLRIFQTALAVRERLVMGRTPQPSGVGSEKPWMPCLKGRLPVAMDVHSIGDSGGWMVAIGPIEPSSMRRWMLGILPEATRGLMTFQSAASQPITRTLGEVISPFT